MTYDATGRVGRPPGPRGRRLVDAVRGIPARTPLRVKLVAALLGLVTVALVVTAAAATTALRTQLVDRVDAQLRATAPLVVNAVAGGGWVAQDPHAERSMENALFVQRSGGGGQGAQGGQGGNRSYREDVFGTPYDNPSPPAAASVGATAAAEHGGEPFTVAAGQGDGSWRAVVTVLPDGTVVTVALSLHDVDSTMSRLKLVEVVGGLAVLVLLGGLGYAIVRSSLRPLVDVERTAEAIAAGDLSRRIRERDPRTEVGRLSRSLNAMLTQIEQAFRSRAASETRARASEERMRRFVADASHELRTPLTSIRGFAELYRQGAVPEPADVDRVMRRIEDESTRMGLLVEDMLLLARLDQQRPFEQRPVDLLTLAGDAVHDARTVDPGRPIALDVVADAAGSAPVVVGDEPRLRQVVTNLVANALTHTPAGTPVTVRVGTVDGPDTGGAASVLLDVVDEGPGLPPEDAARVFERFFRADPSRTRAAGGTGLGLSIVAALVAAHGGTVSLDTVPGRGAAFRVRLPLAPGAEESREAAGAKTGAATDAPGGATADGRPGPVSPSDPSVPSDPSDATDPTRADSTV